MNSKKAITLLVLASMIMALVPVMPASAALTTVRNWYVDGNGVAQPAYKVTGVKGDVGLVNGSGVTPGSTIELYWDLVQAWDGSAGLLNSTSGQPSGAFNLHFTVPEAKKGNHYLWVKDTSTGETVKVDLGTAGDEFVVNPKVSVSPSSGLIDDTITVSGYGFAASDNITGAVWNSTGTPAALTLSPAAPDTNALGSWTATFVVPTGPDKTVTLSFTDGTNTNTTTFSIGPAITLSSTEGPSGSVVTVNGRGYTSGMLIKTASVSMAGVGPVYVVGAPISVGSAGTFSAQIVIPMVGTTGEKTITIANGTKTADAKYTVNGNPSISVTPSYEEQLKPITITGKNFTKIADTSVNVSIAGTGFTIFKTDANGEFTGTLTIPAIGSGAKTILATTDAHYLNASKANFRVGSMMVSMTPGNAKVGEMVALNGFGFTNGGAWNATLGGKTISTGGTASGAGVISDLAIYVPQLDPGTYEVYVYDIGSGIGVTTTFTVDATTSASTTPSVGPNGYTVTIKGENFKHAADTLTFRMHNDTKSSTLTVTGAAAVNAAYGNFSGTFTVPASGTLSIGAYTINITAGDYSVAIPFSIVSPTLDIEPRKSEFSIGDTVNFDVAVSFAKGASYVKIMDPSGNLFWNSTAWATSDWTEVDTTWYFPYYKQTAEGGNLMQLSESAPLGTWTWKWYDSANDLIDNGTFTVVAATTEQVSQQVEDLNQEIMDLADQLTGVTGEIGSVKDDVSDVAAIAEQAVAAAQAAADAVNAVAQTANTASQAADNAADAAEAAREAASGLTTLVYGAIGAALVAALAAIVSLMQISRRIAG